jgi:hypothetical protein
VVISGGSEKVVRPAVVVVGPQHEAPPWKRWSERRNIRQGSDVLVTKVFMGTRGKVNRNELPRIESHSGAESTKTSVSVYFVACLIFAKHNKPFSSYFSVSLFFLFVVCFACGVRL